MKLALHEISFPGGLLRRGFWLYMWEIKTPAGYRVHYVGRTGDKASGVSQSPFDRFSKHHGANPNNNALQRHLKTHKLQQEDCLFRFHALGPLLVGHHPEHERENAATLLLQAAAIIDLIGASLTDQRRLVLRAEIDLKEPAVLVLTTRADDEDVGPQDLPAAADTRVLGRVEEIGGPPCRAGRSRASPRRC